MKIVFFTSLTMFNALAKELREELIKSGKEVVIIDTTSSLYLVGSSNSPKPYYVNFILKVLTQTPKIRVLFAPINSLLWLKRFLNSGDIVHIHYVQANYEQYLALLKEKKVKLVTTIWGSDYLRLPASGKEKLHPIFEASQYISMVDGVKRIFLKENPQYEAKTKTTFFGLKKLELDASEKIQEDFIKRWQINTNKIVVCIGNNGSHVQQHLKVLEQIALLSKSHQAQLHLVLPMTYGLNPAYREEVVNSLSTLQCSASIIDQAVEDTALIALHKCTDLLLFFQVSDAFSAFLSESLYHGAIAIAGKWLPYAVYKDWDIEVHQCDFSELPELIVQHLYKKKITKQPAIKNQLQWSSAIRRWLQLYH